LCARPDLFGGRARGRASDSNPEQVSGADLYYDSIYDLAVRDMEDNGIILPDARR
jgi:hypothetical protein